MHGSLQKHEAHKAITASLCTIITLLLLYTQAGTHAPQKIAWACLFVVALSIRYIHAYRLSNSLSFVKDTRIWRVLFTVYTFLAGACWGLLPTVFQPDTFIEKALLSLIVCIVLTLATTTLSRNSKDYVVFSSSAVIPLTAYHFISNENGLIAIALFVTLFYFVLIKLSLLTRQSVPLVKPTTEPNNSEIVQLISDAGHDLKQPLHALGLGLENLSNEDISMIDKQKTLRNCQSSFKAIDNLFTSIIEISNIGCNATKPHSQHIMVEKLFEKVINQTVGSKIKLNTHKSHIAFCDLNSSLKAIKLIIYSLKSKENNNEINLKSIQKRKYIEIHIESNESNNTSESGLEIAKFIINHQQQRYSIKSSHSKGTIVSFKLPIGDLTQLNTQHSRSASNNVLPFKKNIIVFEKRTQTKNSTAGLLTNLGQNTVEVTTLTDVFQAIRKARPDILMYDFELQEKADMLNTIEELDPVKENIIQLALMSGETESSKVKEIRQYGYPLLHKPLNKTAITSFLNTLHKNTQ